MALWHELQAASANRQPELNFDQLYCLLRVSVLVKQHDL
jgi:hypothetical protein